jgi:glycosyltransferase involved in cell wall biosynthesis
MIVKNEGACLDRCLNSVKGADEIVIIDTGSTDNTGEIARKYTDKYYPNEYKWNDSFCEARNYALQKCTGDWVLSIDADECLEEGHLEKCRRGIAFAEKHNQRTINLLLISEKHGDEHYFPRLFKRCPEVFWKGAIHNYLSVSENNKSDIKIRYGYSEAHKLDSDRSLRILKKEVTTNDKCVREVFYLAREYWYKNDYISATYWYKEYLKKAFWAPEMAEAYLMLAKCHWYLQKGDEARDYCLQAIKVNADFKEALLFMAEMSGVKNREKWLLFAEMATDENVLFARNKKEKGNDYYNRLFSKSSDMSRYEEIYKTIGNIATGRVLDVGCGVARLQKYIADYHGFDFSDKAVEIANNPNIWVGSAYDYQNYGDYDTYILTEILEHLDDLKVLRHIPQGKKVIFSVPSFNDESHLRIYNEKIVRYRYKSMIDIERIMKFSWHGKWMLNGKQETSEYILLVEGIKI